MTTLRTVCAALAAIGVAALVASCGRAPLPGREPEPNLAAIRAVTWTNTAQELAGVPRESVDTQASMSGFGTSAWGGATSALAGNLVLSAVWTTEAVTVAGQSARSGAIVWRRHLPTGPDGYAECVDDTGGPFFTCKVATGTDRATIWVIADRTGAVRTKIPVQPETSAGMSGDDLYLATFKPAKKDTRLDVTLERRSWSSGHTAWRQKASFAIDGWGHDGGQGFDIGKDRVAAYSASWQVIVDRATGRLLDRADQGRWEHELSDGLRVVIDSGDGTSRTVQATLFASDGRPIAETTESTYPDPFEIDGDRVVVGRHVLNRSTGHVDFSAPRRHIVVAVADRGRIAVVEPEDSQSAAQRAQVELYDLDTGKHQGTVRVARDLPVDVAAGGFGAVWVVQNYDAKTDTMLPATLRVIDVRKAAVAATIPLGKASGDPMDSPTILRTPVGAVVTGAGAVRGFVTER